MSTTFKVRRDTAGNWTTANPTLALGEPGYETNTRKIKYGDGTTAWSSLGYAVAGSADKLTTGRSIAMTGDVSWSIASFDGSANMTAVGTIGANAVTFSKFIAATQAAFVGATAAGNFGELTPTQATAQLNAFTSALKGLAPASGGGTANFLRADGSWGVPPGNQSSISGNAGTATALATPRTLAITGDLAWTSPSFDGSANVTAAGTLATVNSNVGTFGSTSAVPVVTVNAKGLVTAVSTVAIPKILTFSAGAASPPLTGTTTETVLATITIPANAIGPNGTVEIYPLFTIPASTNLKTMRVKMGGTTFVSSAQSTSTVTGWAPGIMITNRNSAASQIGALQGAGANLSASLAPVPGTIDTTASTTVEITGQLANTGETITLERYLVRVTYGA